MKAGLMTLSDATPVKGSPLTPPACHQCGKRMDPGFIRAKTWLGRPATPLWTDAQDPAGAELVPAPVLVMSDSPGFRAFRCAACGRLEVDYATPVNDLRLVW